ncbi:TetR family transcriptional regulator [Microcella putealis]|uniref:TetR family transcriptional regulator n=1 Tax=Microcella putealis TaxID=337005 RepID=A0A4Q7LU85_9MICO|nr:TetR/AcrR family transcriptional regulator [Microcella putealis]RZS57548.1 TetR family transcriptional regulator [Microcella putealis]TQM24615.1 TetR family transcriptional regulator [Microcella putealis]
MTNSLTDVDRVLDVAADLIVNDGYDAVSMRTISERSGYAIDELEVLFDSSGDVLISMLNREFSRIYASIVDNVERDPRGGLLSRVYLYILSSLYERPLARSLFLIDRSALNAIMRNNTSFRYVPQIGVRGELIEALQEVGMVSRDVDPFRLSAVISSFTAGLALTAPHDDLDTVVRGLSDLLARGVDEDVDDTEPGKQVFYRWATSLTGPRDDRATPRDDDFDDE